ncbi:hypothetical protein STEG23_023068, partial [Scotinomys teguina]
ISGFGIPCDISFLMNSRKYMVIEFTGGKRSLRHIREARFDSGSSPEEEDLVTVMCWQMFSTWIFRKKILTGFIVREERGHLEDLSYSSKGFSLYYTRDTYRANQDSVRSEL